jgi:hypothetical protein
VLKGKARLLRYAPTRIAIAILIGLCASLGLIAAPASAAPRSSTPTITVTFVPSHSSHASGPDASLTVIVCTINVDNPHHSGHNPGTAGAQAQTTCNHSMASIRMSIQLWWSGYDQGIKTESNTGQSSLSFGYYVACTSGGWQATASALLKAPPGYTPASGDIYDTKVASVTC